MMSKLTTGVAYSVSAGEVVHGVLTFFSPEEWSAVGVLAGISLATITCIINWYYRRKATLAEIRALHCTCQEEPR
ncbi:class II holin family protein [Pantoea vagans]|uniref:class II holin family protein n=1 Tax=Pantoea vagans TaxID=470934 RepID=UPI0028EBF253|nr:class II holin family protein [Pantoea vagans]